MALSMKRLTADAHRRAETAALATRLFESRARYVAYLARLLPFYEAIESELVVRLDARRDPAFQDLAMHSRLKAPLLARDLQALAPCAPLEERPSPPLAPVLPTIRSTADALGVAYVLEGKTLGARFLLQQARIRLDLGGPDDGAAFLAGYEESTAERWNTYRASLEAFVSERGCRAALVRAACATFEAFIRTVRVVAS